MTNYLLRFERPGYGWATWIVEENAPQPWYVQYLDLARVVPPECIWSCSPIPDTEDTRDALMALPPLREPQGEPVPQPESTSNSLTRRLSEHFPSEVLQQLNKGRTQLTYVPVAEVIVRLNEVIGVGNWSSMVISCERDPINTDWIIAHVRLSVKIGDSIANLDGYGGQLIKYMRDSDTPVDVGDDYKGACSDALKKAAQLLGVGLELSRKESALAWEEQREAEEADPKLPDEDREWLKAEIGALPDQVKTALRQWWQENRLASPDRMTVSTLATIRPQLETIFKRAHQQAPQNGNASAGEGEPDPTTILFGANDASQGIPGGQTFDAAV